jgi:HTH-type transcriptional regulator/antitoxin HipB
VQKLITTAQLQQAIFGRRRKLGLSQAKVATLLGISQARYSQIESDPSLLTFDRLLTLTSLLDIELHISLKEESQTPPALGARGTVGGRGPRW